jgi:hypothetical protein
MKLLYRASYTNLDGFTRTTYRIMLFGFTLMRWRTAHKSQPNDWQ